MGLPEEKVCLPSGSIRPKRSACGIAIESASKKLQLQSPYDELISFLAKLDFSVNNKINF